MSAPGLVAGYPVTVPCLHGPGLQPRKVGSGIGFGHQHRGQYVAGCNPGQVTSLLLFGPGLQYQFRGNLGAGGERAHTQVSPAQLFRDDAHRELAGSMAAVLFRDTDCENPHFSQLADQAGRDKTILPVPFARLPGYFFICKTAELLPDQGQRRIQGWINWLFSVGQQLSNPHTVFNSVAVPDQLVNGVIGHQFSQDCRGRDVAGTEHLVLAHGNTVQQLLQVSACPCLEDGLVQFRKSALLQ